MACVYLTFGYQLQHSFGTGKRMSAQESSMTEACYPIISSILCIVYFASYAAAGFETSVAKAA